MPEIRFGEASAERYDRFTTDRFDPAYLGPEVDFMAALAGDGAALEFAIGTGRVGLALSERGVEVHGIDISEPMVKRLKAKPGSEKIPVTIGDFATTKLNRKFRLVYLVFNTIENLITQDEQVECFRNAGDHLEPGGCFVIEVTVPDLRRLPPGETARPFTITPKRLGIDTYDVANQILHSHHYYEDVDGSFGSSSGPFRYAWPAEYDLMARIGGMRLRERWEDYHRTPFTAESRTHVSVWEKVGVPL